MAEEAEARRRKASAEPEREARAMELVVRCTCGYEIRHTIEQELIQETQAHAREAHDPALSDEQVLAIVEVDQ